MSFVEKMDVLDLIIETLKEHERALSDLAYRLEACLRDGYPRWTRELTWPASKRRYPR